MKIYIVIFIYFLAGAIGFYRISRKKPGPASQRNWIKLVTYFVIIHILFFSILLAPVLFRAITLVIAGMALIELYLVYRNPAMRKTRFFAGAVFIWAVLSFGFYHFSLLSKGVILFTFLIVSIFDSFSQITGQLWGRKKIFPSVSPGKTLGGLIGGTLIALFSAVFLGMLLHTTVPGALFRAVFIVFFAFAGDLVCSYYKRAFNTKDFSAMIPGHGGFLDRFDSLIAGGAWTAFSTLILNDLSL